VLAATHRSLAETVNAGTFREDLYYRLAVVEVELPPLRARREDLAVIAQRFYERFTGTEDRLPDGLLAAIQTRACTGNVRELRNFVERSVTLGTPGSDRRDATGQPLAATTAGTEVPVHLPLREARVAWMDQFERRYADALLQRTGGNVTRAAEIAGVHRRSFQRLLASLGGRLADQGATADDDD
jgi:two-component system nitrogen regulation response regulator NtrX